MYIAARAGPMELPIIRIRLAMPSDMPLFCLGEELRHSLGEGLRVHDFLLFSLL
jgi:hypothetical protein